MLHDNELTITWHLRQAISLSAKSRCLVTQCNYCANLTTPNQVRSLRRGQNRSIWTFSSQVFELIGIIVTFEDQQRRTIRSLYGFYSSKVDRFETKNTLTVELRNFWKCTVFADVSQALQIITQLTLHELCFTSVCKWLIKRRLNSTEVPVIPHVEICYRIWLPIRVCHIGKTALLSFNFWNTANSAKAVK